MKFDQVNVLHKTISTRSTEQPDILLAGKHLFDVSYYSATHNNISMVQI